MNKRTTTFDVSYQEDITYANGTQDAPTIISASMPGDSDINDMVTRVFDMFVNMTFAPGTVLEAFETVIELKKEGYYLFEVNAGTFETDEEIKALQEVYWGVQEAQADDAELNEVKEELKSALLEIEELEEELHMHKQVQKLQEKVAQDGTLYEQRHTHVDRQG